MSAPVIGLHALPGSGKDTVADHLVAKHGFVKLAFADAVKNDLCRMFKAPPELFVDRGLKSLPSTRLALAACEDEYFVEWAIKWGHDIVMPRTPRWMMQTYGTDFMRAVDPTYWIRRVQMRIAELPVDQCVVVSDVRPQNEADAISAYWNSQLWAIVRPNNPYECASGSHSSNAPLCGVKFDQTIVNDGTIDDLLLHVDNLCKNFARAS